MVDVRTILFLTFLAFFCDAQRSPYAPRPVEYPGVLPIFQTNESKVPEENTLSNRFGTPSQSLPGTLYDQATVDMVSKWPREKQPFWYLNAAQIAAHKGLKVENQTKRPQVDDETKKFVLTYILRK